MSHHAGFKIYQIAHKYVAQVCSQIPKSIILSKLMLQLAALWAVLNFMLALDKILTDYTHHLAHPFPEEANPHHRLPSSELSNEVCNPHFRSGDSHKSGFRACCGS